MNYNIAIVTPVKNELANLQILIKSVEEQNIKIFAWIIVENDSYDGTKEFLQGIVSLKNVEHFILLHKEFEDKTYQLGHKYSSIIKHGFDYITQNELFKDWNYIGILDADCFPEKDYYKKLLYAIEKDNKIGIISGRGITPEDKHHKHLNHFARGSARIWTRTCFEDAGYFVSMSADSVSAIKARVKGYKVIALDDAFFTAREAGNKIGSYQYYGAAAYYNGFTLPYVVLKSAYKICTLNIRYGIEYFKGFYKPFVQKSVRNKDEDIINYNRKRLSTRVRSMLFNR